MSACDQNPGGVSVRTPRRWLVIVVLVTAGWLVGCGRDHAGERRSERLAALATAGLPPAHAAPDAPDALAARAPTTAPLLSNHIAPDRIKKRVLELLHLTGRPLAVMTAGSVQGSVVRLTWRETPTAAEVSGLATRDGRWLSRHPVDVGERMRQLRADQALSACLRRADVRVLLDDGEPSKKLARELGFFSSLLTVHCGGGREQQCDALGHGARPVTLAPAGAWVGHKRRAWFEKMFKCAPGPATAQPAGPQPLVPQPATSLAAVAEQLRQLHELGSGLPTFVVGVVRQGDALTVTLRQRGTKQGLLTEVLSSDGRWILADAVYVPQALARARLLRRRVNCLIKVGAQIYVGDDSADTRKQLSAIGPLARYLVHDCRDKKNAVICKTLRKRGLPALVVGSQVVAKRLDPVSISSISACP